MPHATPCGNRSGAFSVTELLLALGVTAALIILLLGAIGPTRDRLDAVRCLTALRSIGAAAQAYISDHDGWLPGPLTDGQRLGYDKTASDRNHLPVVLGKYLGLPDPLPAGNKQYAYQIACPAWEKQLGPSGNRLSTPCYIAQRARVNQQVIEVFGRTTEPKKDPLRHLAIDTPASQPAFIDADALLTPNYAGRMPPGPVHHPHHRHALFFDWHAEPIPSVVSQK